MAKEQSLEVFTNRNDDERNENITYPTYSN